ALNAAQDGRNVVVVGTGEGGGEEVAVAVEAAAQRANGEAGGVERRLQFVPAQWARDGSAGAGAGRVGRRDGLAVRVLAEVEVHAVGRAGGDAPDFGHQRRGALRGEAENQRGELLGLGEAVAGSNRNPDVGTGGAGSFAAGGDLELVQQAPQNLR